MSEQDRQVEGEQKRSLKTLESRPAFSSFVLLGPAGSVQHVRENGGMEKGEKE